MNNKKFYSEQTISERSFSYQRSVTYDDLINLMNRSGLQPATQYLLNDYKTKYCQPYTNVIKEADFTERLIITATSDTTISPIVFSLDHTDDIIYYDVNNKTCEDGKTPRNGFIDRRIDTVNFIDMPNDWRRIFWARFKATALTWTSGSVTRGHVRQSGDNLYIVVRTGTPISSTDDNFFQKICTTNDYFFTSDIKYEGLTYNMSDYAQRYTFNANDDLTLKSPTQSRSIDPEGIYVEGRSLKNRDNRKGLCNNVFMYKDENTKPTLISLKNNCHGNTFMSSSYSITFANNCFGNVIREAGRNITFGSSCFNNILGTATQSVTFGSNCSNNTFSHGCQDITFGSSCHSNIIYYDCLDIKFGSHCHSNSFRYECIAIDFGSRCYSNIFGYNCHSNFFASKCHTNFFGNDCNRNTFGSTCTDNNLGNGSGLNTFTSNCWLITTGEKFIENFIKQCAGLNVSNISILHNNENTCTILRANDRYVAHHYATTTATTPTVTQL